MQSYQERVTPGTPSNIPAAGSIFYVKSSSAGEVLTVQFTNGQAQSQPIVGVGKGFKVIPVSRFDGVRISTSTESVVEFIVADGDVNFAFNTDEIIIGNDDSKPLPVRTVAGQPLRVIFDEAINLATVRVENDLRTIIDAAPVAVGVVATSISNDPTLKKIRFRNSSNMAFICIGGAGVGLGSPIILQPGEVYFEDDAAGAHIYAIASGEGAILQIQGLKR